MRQTSTAARWVDRILTAAWVLTGGAFAVGMGIEIAAIFPLARPQTTWESAPLEIAWRVREGEAMYADWREGPVHVGVYGPAYYQLIGTLARLADLNRPQLVTLARGLSVAAFGVALLLLALLAAHGGNRAWAWAVPLVALGSIPVQSVEFIASARPDTLVLALSLAGLMLAMRSGTRSAVGAAGALWLAVFCKPTALAVPLTVALAFFWEADRRRLRLLLSLLCGAAVGGVVAIQAATGGLFWLHQQVTLAAPQKWAYTLFVLTKGREEDQPRALAAMVAIALLTRFVRPRFDGLPGELHRSWRWATTWFLAATAVALVTARRQGSNINYLIEPILAGGWILALWARSVAATTDRLSKTIGRVLAAVGLFNPTVLYLDAHVVSARQVAQIATLLGPDYAGGGRWLAGMDKPLLCMDPWLAWCAGVDGYVNDPIAFGSMCETRPDRDVLTARVKRRFFASVVTVGPLDAKPTFIHQDIQALWPALRQALQDNYVLAERHSPWFRYVPR